MRAPRLLLAAAVLVWPWLHSAAAIAAPARLCIVPVLLSPASKHYSPYRQPSLEMAHIFPGSRWPLFTAWGAGQLNYVLNENDQLEVPALTPYGYVTEPSGRLVGFSAKKGAAQLYIQNPADGRFAGVDGTDDKAIGFVSSAAWISSRQATLIGTSTGLFLMTDEPTPAIQRLVVTGSAVGRVQWIGDLPLHHAAALGTEGGSAFVLGPDNRALEIPGFQIPRTWGAEFAEIGDPDRLLIQAGKELWTVPLRRDGDATIPGRARQITSYVFEGSVLQYYPAIQRYLVYARTDGWMTSQIALLELRDELTPVAGSTGLDQVFIRNIASRGIVTVETFKRGVFVYDGKSDLKPVPHSTEIEIGSYPKVYDVAGQGKVLVLTSSGLYELNAANRLDRLPLPVELEGAKFDQLAELPASHVAVVFTDRGPFELDPAGTLTRIPGGENPDSVVIGVAFAKRLPVREALFVSTFNHGSFMILDERKAGSGACTATR